MRIKFDELPKWIQQLKALGTCRPGYRMCPVLLNSAGCLFGVLANFDLGGPFCKGCCVAVGFFAGTLISGAEPRGCAGTAGAVIAG